MWNHDGDRCVWGPCRVKAPVFPLKWSDIYDPQCETRPRIGVISPPDDIRGVKVTTLFGVSFFYWFFFLVTADCCRLDHAARLSDIQPLLTAEEGETPVNHLDTLPGGWFWHRPNWNRSVTIF